MIRSLCIRLLLAAWLAGGPASAQSPSGSESKSTPATTPLSLSNQSPSAGGTGGQERLHRPHASFDLLLGWMGLPTAKVCNQVECKRGDSSPHLELWGIAHLTRRFAFGAGATWGYAGTTVLEPPLEGASASRNYLTFEGVARYYLVQTPSAHWWLGPGAGLAVLGDRFIAGPRDKNHAVRIADYGAQLSTQGASAFVASAWVVPLSRHFFLGGGLRLGGFFFPKTPKTTPLGDPSSLTGPTLVVSGGIILGLRSGA